MAHPVRDKDKLIRRVQRIIGQVEGVKRALDAERDCNDVMQRIVTARGSLNGLLAEVVEDHIREHMVDSRRRPTAEENRAAQELIDVTKRYLR